MELFNYLLKVSACSALFFAFYLLVLRNFTFFKINRFYLLFSVLLSFIIPALQITIEREVVASAPIENPLTAQDVDLGGIALETPIIVGTGPVKYEQSPFDWYAILPYLYGLVVAALLLLTAWRIYQLLKHTTSPVKEINGLKLVAKQSGFTNCSFFNYVFIDENSLTQSELAVLLAHEEVHAKQYHSADKLMLMIAKAFLWFNPVIYLYDKALEQTHEYEADEATSESIGTEIYATLLLKLAVSKSSNPLIHNFVKSPIKQRIKMLFNSKSENMKKLAYLLVLPLGVALTWLFAVQVVYAAAKIQPTQNKQVHERDSIIGKKITGKVVGFGMGKKGKVSSFKLKSGDKIYPIDMFFMNAKINIGDELIVAIGGSISQAPPPIGPEAKKHMAAIANMETTYMAMSIYTTKGKKVWVYVPEYHAFGYETNRARYATSTIKSIEKNANGTINKIVLNDKHGFIINLNVAAQQFKTTDFKKGDEVVVKFIGEKLVAPKTYTTDKMITLYSWPKKHELINQTLYPRFYDEKGRQKVYNKLGQLKIGQDTKASYTPVKVFPKPILVGSNSIRVDNKTKVTYITDAVMKVFNGDLKAKEVEVDEVSGIITAKKARFKLENGRVTESELMIFNSRTGGFTASYPTGFVKPSAAFNLISKMDFSSLDSIKVSKLMDESLMLTGHVKLKIDNYVINGRVITVNMHSNIITAYSGFVKNANEPAVKAEIVEFDVVTKEIKVGKSPWVRHEHKL